MASGEAVINHCARNKMFSWTFNDFDKISVDHLCEIKTLNGQYEVTEHCLMTSPIIAFDPLNGTKYHATCRLQLWHGDSDIVIEICPFPGKITTSYQKNNGDIITLKPYTEGRTTNKNIEITYEFLDKRELIKKLNIFLDVSTFSTKTFQRLPFHQSNKVKLYDEMKLMWKNDENAEFAIKCETKTFKIAKPIMAARSPVFKKMFEIEMKEKSENFVEIREFAPKIVEK